MPIIIGDAALSQKFAARMLEKGVLRDRVLLSGGAAWHRARAHSGFGRAFTEDLEFAVNAFAETNEELKD